MKHEQFDSDDVMKNIIRKGGLEQPSFNFTNTVMSKIHSPQSAAAFIYQPVISRKAWITIGALFVALCGFVFLIPPGGNSAVDLSKYILPAQQTINNALSKIAGSISFINSFSTLVIIAAAGWLLFAADKYLRRMVFTS
ncbi:MAG: hypothetical protein ACHQNT_13610 [Bacteroidia bacterium]